MLLVSRMRSQLTTLMQGTPPSCRNINFWWHSGTSSRRQGPACWWRRARALIDNLHIEVPKQFTCVLFNRLICTMSSRVVYVKINCAVFTDPIVVCLFDINPHLNHFLQHKIAVAADVISVYLFQIICSRRHQCVSLSDNIKTRQDMMPSLMLYDFDASAVNLERDMSLLSTHFYSPILILIFINTPSLNICCVPIICMEHLLQPACMCCGHQNHVWGMRVKSLPWTSPVDAQG